MWGSTHLCQRTPRRKDVFEIGACLKSNKQVVLFAICFVRNDKQRHTCAGVAESLYRNAVLWRITVYTRRTNSFSVFCWSNLYFLFSLVFGVLKSTYARHRVHTYVHSAGYQHWCICLVDDSWCRAKCIFFFDCLRSTAYAWRRTGVWKRVD